MPLSGATVAFDLDGTLVDTAPDLIGVLNTLLADHGLPPRPLAAARHLVGRGAGYLLQHGFAEAGARLTADQLDRLVTRFLDIYLARIARESRPFEGLERALDQLAAAGARLCVCTNKRTDLSVALLAELGLLGRFAAVAGADSVSARKPAAAHLVEAVARSGGDPAYCLMIGDSATDVACARAASAPVAVTAFGYTEIRPADLGADAVFAAYAELPEIAVALISSINPSST